MKRFKFEDINDGYTFEVSDAEGLVGTISVELKTFMEDQEKQIAELKDAFTELEEVFDGNGVPNHTWVKNRIKQALKE